MEVEKIAHDRGVDQQHGVERFRVSRRQRLHFVFDLGLQFAVAGPTMTGAAAIRVWRQRLSSGSQIVDSRSMYSGCGAASRSRNPAPFACRCAFPRPALERPSSNIRAAAREIFRLQCSDQPTHAQGQQYRGDLGSAAGQVALRKFAGKGQDRHGHRHPDQ